MAYVRTVKTASGATAVRIVHSSRKGSRDIEHIGSAHDDAQLELLKAAARQRLAAGQGEFDLGLEVVRVGKAGGPLPITSSRMGHLWDALSHAYDALGFDTAADGDEVFRCLVLARIIEPTSKLDSLRVLEEAGIRPPSHPTVNRRLPVFETTTMLPTIKAFMAAHRLSDVVIVADAGMISEKNMKAIEAEGLSFILGIRIPEVPYVISEWQREHPGEPIPDGHVFVQPWPAGPTDKRRNQVRYYQYKHDRARRTLKGIDEQVRKAEQAVAGKTAVKRNRFITLTDATKSVNRELEAKARALAGIKGYVTTIADPTHEKVIAAYHRLFQIEKSFRMAKSDLAARPIFHRTRDSIEAHLTIVFAALAISRWIEDRTGWSIKKFVRTRTPLPHYRDPGRRADHHRRRPTTRRPQRRARGHPPARPSALT